MNKKIIISFALMAALTLSVAALMIGCGTDAGNKPPQTEQTTTAETLGVAYPTLMTYEEYKKLSPQLQQAYYETFPTPELYMQWFNAAVQAYNQAAGSGDAPEVDDVGEITMPTEASGGNGKDSTKVPEQSSTQSITENTNTSSSNPNTQPPSDAVDITETTTQSDMLTGWGEVTPGRE